MKKRQPTRPRKQRLSFNTDEPTTVTLGPLRNDCGVELDFTSLGIENSPPCSIVLSTEYDRPKGSKIVTRSNQQTSRLMLDENRRLLDFGTVIAIDTNTDPETQTSISVSMLVRNIECDSNGTWKFKGFFPQAFLFNSMGLLPERFAWHNLLLRLLPSEDVVPPTALIVDAYLDSHDRINAKTEPINEGFFLPENYTMLYASADTGSEFIANASIRLCDKMAKSIRSKGIALPAGTLFQYFSIPQSMVCSNK